MKRLKIYFAVFLCVLSCLLALYMTYGLNSLLQEKVVSDYSFGTVVGTIINKKQALLVFISLSVLFLLVVYVMLRDNQTYKSGQMRITDTISTPVAAGQGQCGTAKWLPKKQYEKVFASYELGDEDLEKFQKIALEDIQTELLKIEKEGGMMENC